MVGAVPSDCGREADLLKRDGAERARTVVQGGGIDRRRQHFRIALRRRPEVLRSAEGIAHANGRPPTNGGVIAQVLDGAPANEAAAAQHLQVLSLDQAVGLAPVDIGPQAGNELNVTGALARARSRQAAGVARRQSQRRLRTRPAPRSALRVGGGRNGQATRGEPDADRHAACNGGPGTGGAAAGRRGFHRAGTWRWHSAHFWSTHW